MEDPSFNPTDVRYIKLGQGGAWAPDAFDQGIIPFGYHSADHAACLAGNWDAIRGQLGRTSAGASQGVREIDDFYNLPDTTLWITFAAGHLWWAFAAGKPEINAQATPATASRLRRTRDGWHRTTLRGKPLTMRSLSSALTRTGNYRMTICAVDRADYLLRRIRDEPEPLVVEANLLMDHLRNVASGMIRQLHWEEFETLVDLIFARDGWRRTSVLGKDQPDVDLIITHQTTGLTASVQVKTSAAQLELDDYLQRFQRDGSYDRFFFVCSNPRGSLSLPADPKLHLWHGEALADAAVKAGLLDWLIERTQ